ncbi:hypothetical protein [Herbaspirillum huttiense]|uniref:hypothetical protein n=1 Tax=Herbaspirillum huttiense TaxID=863372 RepID=UPI002E78E397|nr:hypothetical protein [Herbaspirillum huttiense]MEE1636934.1 hypothetical protein [Herbaspirillum huttiense NC40101]
MDKFQGAVIKEQGVTFAIVVVKPSVLQVRSTSENFASSMSRYFPGVPIILMAQDGRGRPSFWGRTDIVNFLSRISISQIPWKEYSIQ